MTKDKLNGLVAVGSLLVLLGLLFLFFNVRFGLALAENWLYKQGEADSSTYEIVMKGYINFFLATGSIFLVSGLITIIVAYYKKITVND